MRPGPGPHRTGSIEATAPRPQSRWIRHESHRCRVPNLDRSIESNRYLFRCGPLWTKSSRRGAEEPLRPLLPSATHPQPPTTSLPPQQQQQRRQFAIDAAVDRLRGRRRSTHGTLGLSYSQHGASLYLRGEPSCWGVQLIFVGACACSFTDRPPSFVPADTAPPAMRAPPFLLVLLFVMATAVCAFLPPVPTSPRTPVPSIGTWRSPWLAGRPA
jgi:hypothetical protein